MCIYNVPVRNETEALRQQPSAFEMDSKEVIFHNAHACLTINVIRKVIFYGSIGRRENCKSCEHT